MKTILNPGETLLVNFAETVGELTVYFENTFIAVLSDIPDGNEDGSNVVYRADLPSRKPSAEGRTIYFSDALAKIHERLLGELKHSLKCELDRRKKLRDGAPASTFSDERITSIEEAIAMAEAFKNGK